MLPFEIFRISLLLIQINVFCLVRLDTAALCSLSKHFIKWLYFVVLLAISWCKIVLRDCQNFIDYLNNSQSFCSSLFSFLCGDCGHRGSYDNPQSGAEASYRCGPVRDSPGVCKWSVNGWCGALSETGVSCVEGTLMLYDRL